MAKMVSIEFDNFSHPHYGSFNYLELGRLMRHLIAVFFLLALAVGAYQLEQWNGADAEVKAEVQAVMHQTISHCVEALDELTEHNSDSLFLKYARRGEGLFEQWGIGIFEYHNEQLTFWSTSQIPISRNWNNRLITKKFIRLNNGWYYVHQQKRGEKNRVALALVMQHYKHENRYLKNQLYGAFDHAALKHIVVKKNPEEENTITDDAGNYLFSLELKSPSAMATWRTLLAIFFLFMSIALILKRSEHWLFKENDHRSTVKLLLFILVLSALRWLMLFNRFPDFLHNTKFFDPSYYAYSYFFPSAGDLVINVLLLFYVAYLIHLYLPVRKKNSSVFVLKTALDYFIFLIVALVLACGFITDLMKGMVDNSVINFDVSDIFNWSVFSYIGLLCLGLLFFSLFLLFNKVTDILLAGSWKHVKVILSFIAIQLILYFVHYQSLDWYFLLEGLWSVPLFLTVVYFKKNQQKKYSFSMLVLLVLLLSGAASVIIVNRNDDKELRSRQFMADKLSLNEDPVAEYLFADMSTSIVQDTFLRARIGNYWEHEEDIKNYLTSRFFSGFWEKYNVQFVACKEVDSIRIAPQLINDHCWSYFDRKIHHEMEPTQYSTLYHASTVSGMASYLGVLPFQGEVSVQLIVELQSKPFIRNEGYPELLLGQKEIDRTIDLEDYSFARYANEQLVTSLGDFNYPTRLKLGGVVESVEIKAMGYSHLVNTTANEVAIVLSKKEKTVSDEAILFSFFFSMFSLLFFILGAAIKNVPVQYSFSLSTFSSKLQLIFVVVILFVIVPFGVGVTHYIKKQYTERNNKYITEKLRSVLTEMEHKIGGEEFLPYPMPIDFEEYLNQILIKFSNVFYTDINLYGLNGQLLATSRSEVFDIGLKAPYLELDAYRGMILDQKSHYIVQEKIGRLSYLSAYVPFRNNENELLAYLNLPYFAKQNELEKDLGGFLITLVNSYLFLIALAIIVAVLFADYLSRPLKLISSKIAALKIGKENELIHWEGDDEIGALVHEYNRMVMELAKNVELLARSEREGAWREMAKQVAHEIKNPLTPMKLSVQHLQRSFRDNAVNLDEQLERVSSTLIQQIDSLTHIADEFSNFAKMPTATKETINIRSILENCMNLFEDQGVILTLTFNDETEEALVSADRDQLMRAFNNIIKNAIQSIPDGRDGKIDVVVKCQEERLFVEIHDNGKGIPEKEQSRIFVPNFTTKSSGMGLGLAMVKNVIELSNGTVSFTSIDDVGTVFIVELPLCLN
jgi:two-component system nitrogen regulation sensor histidine kinase NtrY